MSKQLADIKIGRRSPKDRHTNMIAILLHRSQTEAQGKEHGDAFGGLACVQQVTEQGRMAIFVHPVGKGDHKFIKEVVNLAKKRFNVVKVTDEKDDARK